MDKEELKRDVCNAIDERAKEIIEVGEWIWQNPESGFKEFKTSRFVAQKFKELGLEPEEGIGITGVLANLKGRCLRPSVAVMGELDALIIPEHPESDPDTGAVHACGHHAQTASVVGLAMGLVDSGIMENLDGSVTLMAVPSEEPIELGWRQEMREKGKLSFLGGKQEFIKAGKFDEIDIALIDHMIPGENYKIAVRGMERIGVGGDGFIAKMVTFRGVEAHSGGNPWSGVNALNAAVLGLIGIHSQRETFRDSDAIRIHQVLSKGGDSLNVVPSDVEMEMMIRGASVEAIKDACIKVDRALQGGAMAVGAEVEITNIPGYLPMPQQGTPELSRLIFRNAVTLLGEKNVISGMPSDDPIRVPTGVVADTRDVANIIPLAGLGVSGIRGRGHSREYYIGDKENAFVNPAKIYAMTIIDLLYEGAVAAKRVIDEYKPVVSKEKYVDHWRDIISDNN